MLCPKSAIFVLLFWELLALKLNKDNDYDGSAAQTSGYIVEFE